MSLLEFQKWSTVNNISNYHQIFQDTKDLHLISTCLIFIYLKDVTTTTSAKTPLKNILQRDFVSEALMELICKIVSCFDLCVCLKINNVSLFPSVNVSYLYGVSTEAQWCNCVCLKWFHFFHLLNTVFSDLCFVVLK